MARPQLSFFRRAALHDGGAAGMSRACGGQPYTTTRQKVYLHLILLTMYAVDARDKSQFGQARPTVSSVAEWTANGEPYLCSCNCGSDDQQMHYPWHLSCLAGARVGLLGWVRECEESPNKNDQSE